MKSTIRNGLMRKTGFAGLLQLFMGVFIAACVAFPCTAADKPAIFIAGDSTACLYKPEAKPQTGWCEVLPESTAAGTKVVNLAMGGTTTKSFRSYNIWKQIMDKIKPGDFVIIQFGCNDKFNNDPNVHASVPEYTENLKQFVKEVRDKKGTPVLCTPIPMLQFYKEGKVCNAFDEYCKAVADVAKEMTVDLVDVNKLYIELLNKEGEEKSKRFYMFLEPGKSKNYPKGQKDITHLQLEGAKAVADIFLKDAKTQKLPIAKCFK
ncbi:MAG TPA: hypothetical protein DET40_11910 [Lentisphaeria bacterium]|nr:MAG: hypothetical protein A2X45_16660 [Lentisphaerae bacterium GWF2_50_93]HCE44244.1 hypothetical protein [Lentisphaeria bacterium]